MDFSEALKHIKAGKSLTRGGWVNKGIALHNHPYQVHRKILTGEETLHTSHLFIQVYENEGYAPWTPSATDLLSEDWAIIETYQ